MNYTILWRVSLNPIFVSSSFYSFAFPDCPTIWVTDLALNYFTFFSLIF